MSELPKGPIHISPGYQLRRDPAAQGQVLLHPEGSIPLTPKQAQILELCRGTLTADEIAQEIQRQAPDTGPDEVREFLAVAYTNNWIHGQ